MRGSRALGCIAATIAFAGVASAQPGLDTALAEQRWDDAQAAAQAWVRDAPNEDEAEIRALALRMSAMQFARQERNLHSIPLLQASLVFFSGVGDEQRVRETLRLLADAHYGLEEFDTELSYLLRIRDAEREAGLSVDETMRLAAAAAAAAMRHHEAVDLLRSLNIGSPDTSQSLADRHNLALHLSHLGRAREAIGLMEETQRDRDRILGLHHNDTVFGLQALARLYTEHGEVRAAERTLAEARRRNLATADDEQRERLERHISDSFCELTTFLEIYECPESDPLGSEAEDTAIVQESREHERSDLRSMESEIGALARTIRRCSWRDEADSACAGGAIALRAADLLPRLRGFFGNEHGVPTSLEFSLLSHSDEHATVRCSDVLASKRRLAEISARRGRTVRHWSFLSDIARTEERCGELAQAEQTYLTLLRSMDTRLFGPDSWRLATESDYARFLVRTGRVSQAIPLLTRVWEMHEEARGPLHPETIRAVEDLALALASTESPSDTRPFEVALQRRTRWEERNGAGDFSLLRAQSSRSGDSDHRFENVVLSESLRGLPHTFAAQTLVARFGRTSATYRRAFRSPGSSPSSRAVAEQVARSEAELQRLVSRGSVDEATAQRVANELFFARRSLEASASEEEARSPREWVERTQTALGPNEALVHFVRIAPYFANSPPRTSERSARYGALVLTSDQTRFTDLGEAERIDALLDEYVESIAPSARSMGRAPLSGRQRDLLGAQLYDRLVRPLHALFRGARRLFLVPDGPLARVPWTAVITSFSEEGRPRYWIDEPVELVMMSNARELTRPMPPPSRGAPLVLAPFATRSDAQRGLPGTASEAETVARLLGRHALLDDAASYDALRVATERRPPRFLHLATHGYARDADRRIGPLAVVGLDFGPDDAARVPASRLAIELDLSGTEVVTLSACETGLGTTAPGQDLASTRQAFHIAGARHVVASLWEVPDDSASFFMARFYGYLVAESPVEEAFRRAVRDTRDHPQFRHPRHWAAFSLSSVPGRANSTGRDFHIEAMSGAR